MKFIGKIAGTLAQVSFDSNKGGLVLHIMDQHPTDHDCDELLDNPATPEDTRRFIGRAIKAFSGKV